MLQPEIETSVEAAAARLLGIIDALVREARGAAAVRATLDSAFDRDLGIDSLARTELMLRIEREFGVSLPERALTEADTPRELLRIALAQRATAEAADRSVRALPAGEAAYPDGATTLPEVLDWHVRRHPAQLHVHLYGENEVLTALSYGALADGAGAIAAALSAAGLEPGEPVAIMLPTGTAYFYSFLGALLAGGIPMPIYPPVRPSQLEEHLERHAGLLANARAVALITETEAKPIARLLRPRVSTLRIVITPDEASPLAAFRLRPRTAANDLALLQYTSGSTGTPKGVALSHANLLANIRAMGRAVCVAPEDVFVSWLPLYHDMGLIGAWLGTLYYGFPLVLMSPLAFLARPQRWLWAIHRHRGTLSAAPNFAYALAARLPARVTEGLDLSSWRYAFNGAEPVSPDTLHAFRDRYARHGLVPGALAPVYGLAECSVGLAFPPPGRGPVIDRVKRETFMRTKRAEPAAADETDALTFVACGRPLSGHAIRVVDAGGRELPEREEGRLEFKGPSATRGYYRNAAATRLLYDGDWLDSGDYAYLAGGEVHLTGRAKDVIIRGGRNVYPYALEQAVGGLAGVRRGCVAVFGAPEAGSGTERIIVVAETRESDAARRAALEQKINETALAVIGMPADEVVLAPPHTVPKTSSGKIRRFASREYYEHGTVPGRPPPVWWQIVRLSARSAWPQLQRHGRAALVTARGAYMLACFVLLAAPTWTLVAAMQRPRLARPFIGFMARLFFRFAALPLRADGFAHIPPGASILTLNHTSYLDAVALCAQLGGSRPYRFAAKREFAAHWFPRWFFSGIGSAFVDRVDPRRGARDVEQFQAALERGETVIFFPEGGFDRQAGLKPFRSGAFALAARTGRPVVPMAIRGARAVLRGGDWLPRPGAIRIVAAAPQRAAGSDWEATIELRDRVRAVILCLCGEADLMA